MRSSASARVGFLLILVCICSATGRGDGALPEGHPRDDVDVVSSASPMDMVQYPHKGLETNTLSHQLQRMTKAVETIKDRAAGLANDSRRLSGQIADALVHLRSVVAEPPSSDREMARQQTALHAGLAATRAAVDAGVARLEASYRRQDDAVDGLREMWRRFQLDVAADAQQQAMRRRRGQNGDGGDHDGLRSRFLAEVRALGESIDDAFLVHVDISRALGEARQALRALHADISGALDHVVGLAQYSGAAPSYKYYYANPGPSYN